MINKNILAATSFIWSMLGSIFIISVWIYSEVSLEVLFDVLPWYKIAIIIFIGGPMLWFCMVIVYGIEFIYYVLSNINLLKYLTTK